MRLESEVGTSYYRTTLVLIDNLVYAMAMGTRIPGAVSLRLMEAASR